MRSQSKELSDLLSELDLHGVPLYGVIHEVLDSEPQDFVRAAWNSKHTLFHDPEKAFFPKQNSGAIQLLSFSFLKNYINHRSSETKVDGNQRGDYKYHGGVIVLGSGEQGILYQMYEETFGDKADLDAVRDAISRIQQ